jgi:hypothetical protein
MAAPAMTVQSRLAQLDVRLVMENLDAAGRESSV